MTIFVPVQTSKAGSCLTWSNWKEIGIHVLSFHLDVLLVKPGFSFLKTLSDLRSYLGWSGKILLNVSLIQANQKGVYQVRSDYDGTLIRIEREELLELIRTLKPDMTVFPVEWAENSLELARYIESDKPAVDAMQAIVYNREGEINLRDKDYAHQHQPIDPCCHCPSCSQQLTRAYLHHLLMQTPLLCQRFLIQHNVFQAFTQS